VDTVVYDDPLTVDLLTLYDAAPALPVQFKFTLPLPPVAINPVGAVGPMRSSYKFAPLKEPKPVASS